jgi:hypothetical protein
VLANLSRKVSNKSIISLVLTVLCALLITIYFWFSSSPNLLGDELFFYFQAQAIKQGKFIWFDNTQPMVFPLFLSFLPPANIYILRFSSIIFACIDVMLLYALGRRFFSASAGLLAGLFLLVHFETFRTNFLLFGEPLALMLCLIVFWYFAKILEQSTHTSSDPWFLGLVLAIFSLTKMQGLIFAGFFILALIVARKITIREAAFIGIPIIIFQLPYQLLHGATAISDKMAPSYLSVLYFPIWEFFKEQGLATALLTAVAIFGPKRTKLGWSISWLIIWLLLTTAVTDRYPFPRHFVLLMPFIALNAAQAFWQSQSQERILLGLLCLFYIGQNAYTDLTKQIEFGNRYVLNPQGGGCLEISTMHNACSDTEAKLPDFSIPSGRTCRYTADFEHEPGQFELRVNYLDDSGDLFVNQSRFHHDSPYSAAIHRVTFEKPGLQHLEIEVYNYIAFGGIGQVLICPA